MLNFATGGAAAGNGAVAIGPGARATGAGAVAIGPGAVAIGKGATAVGKGATAEGEGARVVDESYFCMLPGDEKLRQEVTEQESVTRTVVVVSDNGGRTAVTSRGRAVGGLGGLGDEKLKQEMTETRTVVVCDNGDGRKVQIRTAAKIGE